MSEIAPSAAFADQLQIFRQRADRALLDFIAPLPFNDGNMVAAMRHGALLGGKRLRPFPVHHRPDVRRVAGHWTRRRRRWNAFTPTR